MGGSLPLAYYNALQEERGEPGPGAGAECVTSEPVPRVVTTRLYGWCLPRRMEGCQENKVLMNFLLPCFAVNLYLDFAVLFGSSSNRELSVGPKRHSLLSQGWM